MPKICGCVLFVDGREGREGGWAVGVGGVNGGLSTFGKERGREASDK